MRNAPVVVEVRVDKAGLFITTTSVLMCGSDRDAQQCYQNQQEMAKALMDAQGLDFDESEGSDSGFWSKALNGRKE